MAAKARGMAQTRAQKAMPLPRVALEDLLQPPVSSNEAWERSVEKLAVSLSRDRFCVLTVPTPHAAAYAASLAVLCKELQSRAPAGVADSPGSKSLHFRAGAGAGSNTLLELTYSCLESTARAVLGALCRSSLLRLRGDTFSSVLDDLPLQRTQQSSSLLTLKSYVDNFQESCAEQAPIFSDPQEEMSDRGLLSVMLPQEARDSQDKPLSVLQAKDASGKWRDVVLQPGEVVVLLGHTMKHATAGVLSPATYRVAGDPYGNGTKKGLSRRLLQFELRPRPTAVLDFSRQLADAGHLVPSKYSAPASVRSLMEEFEQLMSPGKVHTPQNMEGVAAHAAWDQQATSKKGRKRSMDSADLAHGSGEAAAAPVAPVTRSGNVRRTSGGLVSQHRPTRFRPQSAPAGEGDDGAAGTGDQEQPNSMSEDGDPGGAGASGGSSGGSEPATAGPGPLQRGPQPSGGRSIAEALRRRRSSLDPASCATLYHVRGRTCTVLDSCLQDDPSECITLCVRSFTGIERWFYLNRSLSCGRVFETYCDRMGISLGAVKFLYKGSRVFGADSPAALQICDCEELMVVPESSDRLQQARELGPLFTTLFATTAGEEVPF